MDKKSISRLIVFILVWVNALLTEHGYKTIPVVDDNAIAQLLAFAYSAFVEIKLIYNWIKTNWVKK